MAKYGRFTLDHVGRNTVFGEFSEFSANSDLLYFRLIGNLLPSGSFEPGEGLFPDDPPGKKMKSQQIRALITTILENSFRIGPTINVMCFH
jgi:hypothetical protein